VTLTARAPMGAVLHRGRASHAQMGAVGLLAVVAALVVVPLGFLAWDTLLRSEGGGAGALERALAGPGGLQVVVNTVTVTVGSTVLAAGIGTALAYLYVRTDVPLRRTLLAAALVPLVMPGLLYAFAWTLLTSPRMGAGAGLLEALPGPAFDPFSLTGIVVIEGVNLSSIAFLLMVAGFRALDPATEEAAELCGASRWTVLRRISIPLVRPALLTTLLLVGLRAVEGFEIPALLGRPARVPVLTTRLYELLRRFPPDPAAAGVVALVLVAVAGLGLLVHHTLLQGRDRFEVLTGRRHATARLPLGRWRAVMGAAVALWFLVIAAAPLAILAWGSALPFYRAPSRDGLGSVTADNYRDLFGQEVFTGALVRSLVLGVGAATGAVLLGSLVAWVVVRTRVRGRGTLDTIALAPLVIPGLVLGLAIGLLWIRVPVAVYGTTTVLLIAYVTAFLPYGVRYAAAAFGGIGSELEESSRMAGAGWWTTMRRIVLPLAGPALAAAWLSIVTLALHELSVSLLLYSPGEEVLPVLLWELWEDGRLPQIAALGVVLLAVITAASTAAYVSARRLVLPDLD